MFSLSSLKCRSRLSRRSSRKSTAFVWSTRISFTSRCSSLSDDFMAFNLKQIKSYSVNIIVILIHSKTKKSKQLSMRGKSFFLRDDNAVFLQHFKSIVCAKNFSRCTELTGLFFISVSQLIFFACRLCRFEQGVHIGIKHCRKKKKNVSVSWLSSEDPSTKSISINFKICQVCSEEEWSVPYPLSIVINFVERKNKTWKRARWLQHQSTSRNEFMVMIASIAETNCCIWRNWQAASLCRSSAISENSHYDQS